MQLTTKVTEGDVQFVDLQPSERDERYKFKFNCPLCLRYFNHMLQSGCCENYICHLCTRDLKAREDRESQFKVECPYRCSSSQSGKFILTDVPHDAKIKRYADSMFMSFFTNHLAAAGSQEAGIVGGVADECKQTIMSSAGKSKFKWNEENQELAPEIEEMSMKDEKLTAAGAPMRFSSFIHHARGSMSQSIVKPPLHHALISLPPRPALIAQNMNGFGGLSDFDVASQNSAPQDFRGNFRGLSLRSIQGITNIDAQSVNPFNAEVVAHQDGQLQNHLPDNYSASQDERDLLYEIESPEKVGLERLSPEKTRSMLHSQVSHADKMHLHKVMDVDGGGSGRRGLQQPVLNSIKAAGFKARLS